MRLFHNNQSGRRPQSINTKKAMTVTDKNVKAEIGFINDKVLKIHDDPDMPVCQARMGKPAPNFKVFEVIKASQKQTKPTRKYHPFDIISIVQYRPSLQAE